MRKRIAIIMHAGIGGGFFSQGQPVIVKLVEQLAKDFDITVYSQLPPNNDAIFNGYRLFFPPAVLKFAWLRWIYLMGLWILHQIKKPYNLIHSFWGYPAGFITVFLGNLFNKPSVIHLQGGDSTSIPRFRYGAFYGSISKKLCSWAYERASLLIALTEFQRKSIQRHGIKRNVEVIPFGPDLNMFRFDEDKFKSSVIRFVHIGNHSPLKDQKTLISAFSHILVAKKNCKLKFIGYDVLNGSLKKYVEELGVLNSIEFVETMPYSKIPYYLSGADIMLHTSLFEGQATVVSEAAACGVLLAGTRVGLLSDLGDDYGIVVDVGDAEGLAAKILVALKDTELIQRYIRQSRNWAEEHDQYWTINTIKTNWMNLIN